MEKIFSTASATILVMSLIVSLDSFAQVQEEIADQSLFFGCLPVRVPVQKSYFGSLDWISFNDEKPLFGTLTNYIHGSENHWGFWNCERAISSHELAPFRYLSE